MTNATMAFHDTNQTSLSYNFVLNNTDMLQSNPPPAFATTDRHDSISDSDMVMIFLFVLLFIVALLGRCIGKFAANDFSRPPSNSNSNNGDGSVPQPNHSHRGRINSAAPTIIGYPILTLGMKRMLSSQERRIILEKVLICRVSHLLLL
mmetsp:Transcript_57821/g.67480  ORF Transcript_57821/g.67480 Transcript_57821/m.67480 type:complete len:149 (-) Transcript_57821:842-1288(-)